VRSRAGLGQLEIVAGERRYRAAKLAGHDVVPVIIRTLSDVEVLELMAIENSQRDDLHPLEEAAGYEALMKADRAYTPEAIAAKIGKSKRYVQQRLQLSRLDPSVKKAFFDDRITAGHADLLSRLTPEDQKAGLKACFDHLFGEDADRGCISVRKLDTWIENNIRIELSTDDPQTAFLPELASSLATLDTAKILQVAAGLSSPRV
jgi:ParB family chromosome partitioning protein